MTKERANTYEEGIRVVRDSGSVREGKLPSPETLADRAGRVQEAMLEERWLPIGLRSLLAQELPWIRKRLISGTRTWSRKVAQRVHELSMATYRYGPVMLDSEAVTQLRILDLELNPMHVSSDSVEAWQKGD